MRKKQTENYLDLRPLRSDKIAWSADNGQVTLEIENKGFWNRLFQKLLKKPPVSYIHLDEMGSFVWPLIDGQRTVSEIGEAVEGHFGDAAKPVYERLVKFFRILESYRFVSMSK